MAIALTDDMILEAFALTPSAKELANQFGMAESSIHYRLAKLRARGLIPATAQPNQHTTKPQPIVRDLMTGAVTVPTMPSDPFAMALAELETEELAPTQQAPMQQTPMHQAPTPQTTTPTPTPTIIEPITVHSQPAIDWEERINALVPAQRPYIERDEDDLFDAAFAHGYNVIIQGEAGTGKTRMVQYYAEKNRLPFLRISCDDSSQLRQVLGTMQASNGTTWFKEGIMLELIKRPCVILFDEFNCLPSSRLFFLHEILDNRRVHIQELDKAFDIHKECKIALACNPNTPRYSGTNKVNAALADRCTTIIMPDLSEDFVAQFIKADDRRKFFLDINRSMMIDQIRASFSLRGATRVEHLITSGMDIKTAYTVCFLNNVRLTASEDQARQIEQTARVIVKGWK